jgi:hypothetical protein
MRENDVLLYLDGRTYYSGKKAKYINDFLSKIDFDGMFWKMDNIYEYQYSKGDYFRLLDVKDDTIIKSEQYAATFFFLRKNDRTMKLTYTWREFMIDNRELFINEYTVTPNLEGFIEKRHDQPILSLLIKKSNELNYIDLSSRQIAQGPLKPHSLPHKNEMSKILTSLPLNFIRWIYLIKRIGSKGIIKRVIN